MEASNWDMLRLVARRAGMDHWKAGNTPALRRNSRHRREPLHEDMQFCKLNADYLAGYIHKLLLVMCMTQCFALQPSKNSPHTQIPIQSAPPCFGSQSSLGSSTHFSPLGQGMAPNPPQAAGLTQIPEQSAPPFLGLQLSFGLSTQFRPGGQGNAAIPPHC